MKKRFLALILMAFSLFIFSGVNAQDINSFYAEAKQNVKMADKIIGDSALAGALVDIDGEIEGIGFVAGQTINLNGDLDYGFLAGQNVKVVGHVDKNVYIAGNTIDFTEDSSIGRDSKIVGESITLSGRFGRDVLAAGSKIIISDKTIIDGNVTFEADEIEIAGNVTIDGTLKYNKDAKIDINDSASIKNIEKTKQIKNEKKINIKDVITSIINLIVAILVLALLLPKAITKTNEIYDDKKFNDYAKKFAIGLLFIICIPIASLILLASHIGTSLGLIFIAIYIITLYLAYGLAGYIFGDLIFNKALKLNINKYLIIIIGIILIKLLALIPILGGLIVLVTTSIGIATLWDLVKENDDESLKKVESKKESESDKIKNRTKISEKPAKKTTTKKSNTKKTNTKK